ncbi:hypothetical protein HDU91_001115 [Kappamyces sp. JEL0680]|nr:hypothetical protein HDU91_001115 [Kappamyces sp. JEL0680]
MDIPRFPALEPHSKGKSAGIGSGLVSRPGQRDDAAGHPIAKLLLSQIDEQTSQVEKLTGHAPQLKDSLLKWKRHY